MLHVHFIGRGNARAGHGVRLAFAHAGKTRAGRPHQRGVLVGAGRMLHLGPDEVILGVHGGGAILLRRAMRVDGGAVDLLAGDHLLLHRAPERRAGGRRRTGTELPGVLVEGTGVGAAGKRPGLRAGIHALGGLQRERRRSSDTVTRQRSFGKRGASARLLRQGDTRHHRQGDAHGGRQITQFHSLSSPSARLLTRVVTSTGNLSGSARQHNVMRFAGTHYISYISSFSVSVAAQ